jgi:hypothetical protein
VLPVFSGLYFAREEGRSELSELSTEDEQEKVPPLQVRGCQGSKCTLRSSRFRLAGVGSLLLQVPHRRLDRPGSRCTTKQDFSPWSRSLLMRGQRTLWTTGIPPYRIHHQKRCFKGPTRTTMTVLCECSFVLFNVFPSPLKRSTGLGWGQLPTFSSRKWNPISSVQKPLGALPLTTAK